MAAYYTKQRLTEKDKKELRYQCRAGIVMIFLIPPALFVLLTLLFSFLSPDPSVVEYSLIVVISIGIGLLIGYKMTNKYFKDIKNDEKELYIKTIDKKEKKIDFEAGSGKAGCLLKDMDAFTSYSFIIENTVYKVDKTLFDQCEEGGQVIFVIAPISQFRLDIVPKSE